MAINWIIEELPVTTCAVIGMFVLGRLNNSLRLLAVHALLAAFTELVAWIIAPGNNHGIFIAFLPLDFLFIVLACKDFIRRHFLLWFVAGLSVFLAIYIYILASRGAELLPFEAIVISWIIQSLFWFVVLLRSSRQGMSRETIAIYLLAGGIMLYTCTSIPVWAMFGYNLVHHPGVARTLQQLCNVTSMLRYAATGIAFILLVNKPAASVRHAVR